MTVPVPVGERATPEERRQAIRLLRTGQGYKSVAKALGLNGYSVRNWMRMLHDGELDAAGERIPPAPLPPREYEALRLEVWRRTRRGDGAREIARDCSRPLAQILYWRAQLRRTHSHPDGNGK